jgi:hypothetical protein
LPALVRATTSHLASIEAFDLTDGGVQDVKLGDGNVAGLSATDVLTLAGGAEDIVQRVDADDIDLLYTQVFQAVPHSGAPFDLVSETV